MSAIGLRVGPFEIVGETKVPEPGLWHLGTRTGMTRRQPHEVLVRLLPSDAPPDDRQALHQQFEILKTIDDPRVPEAIAFYEGLGALALTHVHGAPLSMIIQQRRDDVVAMSPATLLDIVLELAETLQRVHHRNRFHGDLSPDRVLLGADGRVWIFGFGSPPGAIPDIRWLAPERANGDDATALTDQWYLGAIAACLVTGQTPFDSRVSARRGNMDPVLRKVDRQWPALGRLLRQMTEPRPDNRFPSMHPVRQELLALARKAGGTSERRDLGATLCPARPTFAAPARDDAPDNAPAEPASPDAETAAEPAPPPGDAAASDASSPSSPEEPAPGDGFASATEELPPRPDPSVDDDPELTLDDVSAEAPPRHPPLPDEAFPVVRPDVSEEVPTAALSGLGASLDDLQPRRPPTPVPEAELGAEVGLSPRFRGGGFDDDDDFSDSDEGATVLMRREEMQELTEGFVSDPDQPADTAVPVTDSGDDGPDDLPEEDEDTDYDAPTDTSIPVVGAPVSDNPHSAGPMPFANPDVVTTQPMAAAPAPVDPVRRLAPLLVVVFLLAFGAWLITQVL